MSKPTTVAVATYRDQASADADYEAVRSSKKHGHLDHVAIAKVTKDADGTLEIDRHNTSAAHGAWGMGIMGAVLTVAAAPLGMVFLGPLAANTAVWAGVGGVLGHFWDSISKDTANRMTELLEEGEHGLVIAAVNPAGTDVDGLLSHAVDKVVTDGITDSEGALQLAFEAAKD